ncbi:hypothetical protein [Streptomyces violens]|uniref:hypothetical protein n=1 Tax=Streptomyces violens TaxID=66377 RepID=UPI0004C23642|nr:hypothetical protein [Streptomyces violens]
MPTDLSPLISATTQWLTCAYPSSGGAMSAALTEAQARQAVTVAAWLRYPTPMDAALVSVTGPGGSGRLDWLTGADVPGADAAGPDDEAESAWRSWVDEVVASWAAALLSTPALAEAAVTALADSWHMSGTPAEFRRLVSPDAHEQQAAALLRHPDLLAPLAELHHPELLTRLDTDRVLDG